MIVNTEPGTRQAIVSLLEAITPTNTSYSDVGRVWNRERTGLASYRYPGVTPNADEPLRAWTVENGGPNGEDGEIREQLDTCSYKAYRLYTLRGYWSLDDAGDSTNIFRTIVADVMNACTLNRDLDGYAIISKLPALVLFASAVIETKITHYAEVVIRATSVEQTSP